MRLPVFSIIYVINSEEEILLTPQQIRQNEKTSFLTVANPNPVPEGVLTAQETMDSLTEDNWNGLFQVKIQMYDICCTQATKKFAQRYVSRNPQNVQYFERKGKSVYQCYNEGLDSSEKADWINLMKATTCYNGTELVIAFQNAAKFAVPIVSLNPFQYMNGKMSSQLYYAKRFCAIDLEREPYYTNFCLDSLFIERSVIGDLRFDEKIPFEPAEFFLIRLYEKAKRYMVMRGACKLKEFFGTDPYNYEPEYEKDWYTKEVKETYLPFLMENPDSIIRQAALVYLVELKFFANGNDRNKSLLSEEEIDEFYGAVVELFRHIPDDVIVKYRWKNKRVLQRFMGMNFLRMKYDNYDLKGHKEKADGEDLIVCENTVVESLENIEFNIMAINYEEGALKIDGEVANVYFADPDEITFYALCDGEKIPAQRNEIYSYIKYFGRSVKKGYMVQIIIPADRLKPGCRISFTAEYEGSSTVCKCFFKKIQSRLHNNYANSYWRFDRYLLSYEKEQGTLCLKAATLSNRIKAEIAFQKEAKNKKVLAFRMLYFLTKPVYGHRNIWLTFDQLFKGGDNGEYFFRHMNEHHKKDADMYYIINEDTKEYKELKAKYGHVLKYHSIRLLLMSLHAKMIFATRVDVKQYCGFTETSETYIRDLFNAEVVCLQHGLTIQKIAQYQNRLFDNLKYYFCVSPYEVENILNPLYGYTPDMMKLTGAPRYDGLTGTPKRQILIAPTWRRNVTAGTNTKGSNHEYSVNFKHTVYFQIYNTLINDKRLIASAKKNNYKLIYLIHPILSPQVDDFDKNEFVEIRPGVDVNYETILKESSLMVSDYSGIQFDFAYMRRPLIYYHPDALPPQYDEGNLKYDTMGFGPVCKNNDEIVETLCRFMENNCQLEPEYKERIEKFFPYDDQNNCERVYEAAAGYQKKIKN